jgi:hypothetical protein
MCFDVELRYEGSSGKTVPGCIIEWQNSPKIKITWQNRDLLLKQNEILPYTDFYQNMFY